MYRLSVPKRVVRQLHHTVSGRNTCSAAIRPASTRLLLSHRPQCRFPPGPLRMGKLYHGTPAMLKTNNVMDQKMEHHPESITPDSTMTPVFDQTQDNSSPKEEDMMKGIRQDMVVIKETFALDSVPRESYYLGAAGIIPFATISLTTLYLSFDVNHAAQHGEGFMFSPELASQLLGIITPIQIGFGAVIISFLGAIHWGLEYAAYGGKQGYSRYMYGVLAPAIAWPTLLMPIETALITQFLAFVFQYFADARATVAGWCPPWYSAYRFVLTFFVGASIVVTLIGRGQIARHDLDALQSPVQSIKKDREVQWDALEREEREKQRAAAKREEEEDEEEDDEDSEEGGEEEEGDETEGAKKDGKEAKKSEEKDDE